MSFLYVLKEMFISVTMITHHAVFFGLELTTIMFLFIYVVMLYCSHLLISVTVANLPFFGFNLLERLTIECRM